MALRAIDKIATMVLLSELGDISRFESLRRLVGFLGLMPSERSSGGAPAPGSDYFNGLSMRPTAQILVLIYGRLFFFKSL